jgi:anthranilate/para-aminobenzoate synthase component I
MANPNDQKGFKGIYVIGLCLTCFSIGLAISWYFMNSQNSTMRLDCEKAEKNLSEISKDLGRVKVENDGLRKLVKDKDDIINRLNAKEPKNTEEQQKLIDQLKSDNIILSGKVKQNESEFNNCNLELSKSREQLSQANQTIDQLKKSISVKPANMANIQGDNYLNYEPKLEKLHLEINTTMNVFNKAISITVTEIKKGKVYGFISSEGFQTLQIKGKEVGQKIVYNADESYEIKLTHTLGEHWADFVIIQYRKLGNR